MPFPRAPKKPVTGKLKLSIKSPTEAVVEAVDPRAEFKDEKDLSSQLQFSLPLGFSIDSETSHLMEKQKQYAFKKLDELREKTRTCKTCYRVTDLAAIDQAQELVDFVFDYLKEHASDPVTVRVGQQPDGAITLNFTGKDRELGAIVYQGSLELGRYSEGVFVDEIETRLLSTQLLNCLVWLTTGTNREI